MCRLQVHLRHGERRLVASAPAAQVSPKRPILASRSVEGRTVSGVHARDQRRLEPLRAARCSAGFALCSAVRRCEGHARPCDGHAAQSVLSQHTCSAPHMTSHRPAKRLADPLSRQSSWPAQIPPAPPLSHGRSHMLLSRLCWSRRTIFRSPSPRCTRSCATSSGSAVLTSPGTSYTPPHAAHTAHEHIALCILCYSSISLYDRSVWQATRCSFMARSSATPRLNRRQSSLTHIMYELCALGGRVGRRMWLGKCSDASFALKLCRARNACEVVSVFMCIHRCDRYLERLCRPHATLYSQCLFSPLKTTFLRARLRV